MAKVVAKVLGGNPQNMTDVETVADVKRRLGVESHTAQVNNRPAEDSTTLRDEDYVALSPAVKGGR